MKKETVQKLRKVIREEIGLAEASIKLIPLLPQNEDRLIQSLGLECDELDPTEMSKTDMSKFLKCIQYYPQAELIKYMESNDYLGILFPSRWYRKTASPYPGKLAAALCKSNASEPMSDLGNIYYGRQIVSPEARKVFAAAMQKDPFGQGWSEFEEFGNEPDHFVGDGRWEAYFKAPEIQKFLKSKYPEIYKALSGGK